MRAPDVYRALLWCYPAEFRHEYGSQMVGAFTEQLRDARVRDGRLAQAAIWARALIDLPSTALQEHGHVIRQDLRHACRILAASPGFTTVAVLSLALGIGANTAIFSLLNGVLMSRLPVRNPHELVILTDPGSRGVSRGAQQGERSLATYEEFLQLQENNAFASLMAASSSLQRTEARVEGGEPEPLAIRLVSTNYFSTLGVPAAMGQTFDARLEPAAGAAPSAVVSHEVPGSAALPDVRTSSGAPSPFVAASSRSSVSPRNRFLARPWASDPTCGSRWPCRPPCCRGVTGCTMSPAASRR